MKTYIVQQSYRGVATLLVEAETAREALEKVNQGCHPDVQEVQAETTWVGKATYVRLDRPRGERRVLP